MPGTRRKGSDAPVDEVPPEELLRTSPFEGDLAEELAAAEPRRDRRLPSATMALAAGVLVVAGFVGGVQADKHWGKEQTAGFPQFARNGQGGAGIPGAGGGRLGAFGGGAQGGTAARSGATGQGGAGGGFGTGAAPGGGAGGGTTGTVKLVDGDVIYVQTADGIVRVKTTGATKVSVTKSAKVKDLKAGASVVVQGTPGQDGGVTATTVTQRP